MSKINITEVNSELRSSMNFGCGTIEVYQPSEEVMNEIIAIQEDYYKDNKEVMPQYIKYMDLVPKLTNIEIKDIDQLQLQEMFENPKLWLKWVLTEIDDIITEVNKIKVLEIKTQMKELDELVSRVNNVIEMPDSVKTYFNENKDTIMAMGDDELIESAKVLNLIETPEILEETEQERQIRELEEQLKQLKGEGV